MKKLCLFTTFLIINIYGNSQVFNIVYPSIRPELKTVDAVSLTIPLKNNEAYFISRGIPLIGPYYYYRIATKVDRTGEVLWHKYISDSLGYFTPRHFEFISNNRIMLAGFKYPPERDIAKYWYGIFDIEMNMLEEHIYSGTHNKADITHFLISDNGDYVFSALDNMLDDRGNGATDKVKAVVFSTDSTGQMKWYYEMWDSLRPKDLYTANKVMEDSQGNFYAFGGFLTSGEFPNWKGLVIKMSPSGKLLWHKIYPIAGYGVSFYSVLSLANDQFLLVGHSADPINFFNDRAESYIYSIVMDTSGTILKSNFKNKSFSNSLSDCVLKMDSTLVCGGNHRPIKDQWTDGRIFSMTMDADIIWESVIDNVDYRQEEISDFAGAPDGGYYLGGYSWLKDNNQARNWLVKTDSLGCDDVSCLDTAVDDPTVGTDEVWLYPNPVHDRIHIASPGGFRSRQFEIYDYTGKKVKVVQSDLGLERITIPMTNLQSGIYLISPIDRSWHRSFVKE
ncbi:MAG: T9SS type A sorting domain-containing protein [Saprospiraceae bacterium]|nr:T9SS type A sorting domain-containing protein [Saprospiraceae bacterium]